MSHKKKENERDDGVLVCICGCQLERACVIQTSKGLIVASDRHQGISLHWVLSPLAFSPLVLDDSHVKSYQCLSPAYIVV